MWFGFDTEKSLKMVVVVEEEGEVDKSSRF